MLTLNARGRSGGRSRPLNLRRFSRQYGREPVGLLTLTYVPNYFDILPMYLVILAMVPVMVALARVASGAGQLVCARCLARGGGRTGPARGPLGEQWSDRTWFFNPFGWQLVFFTGFALMAGWLPRPPVRPNAGRPGSPDR